MGQKKKAGKFIVLKADPDFQPPEMEFRMCGGLGYMQKRNDVIFNDKHLEKVVTKSKDLPEKAKLDMILASIVIKYTQSNSVGYSLNGMMVGVGARQQSRVDCVKLAGRKVATWKLRFHPKVMALPFKDGVHRQDRVNARVRFIEGDMDAVEYEQWAKNFATPPVQLSPEEKSELLKGLDGVAISSDAF